MSGIRCVVYLRMHFTHSIAEHNYTNKHKFKSDTLPNERFIALTSQKDRERGDKYRADIYNVRCMVEPNQMYLQKKKKKKQIQGS